MVRTHPSSDYKYPEYDRLNRRQKDDLQRRPSRDMRARMARIDRKPWRIHCERSIDMTALPASSVIPDMIRWRGWERFVEHPGGYDPEIVRDFYAGMHPPTFLNRKTVMMGQVQVRITPRIISEYFGVPYHPNLEATFGLADNPVFQVPYNGVIASALRRNGSPVWDSKDNRLLKSDLHYDMAFLLLFVKANLKPSTFCTAVDQLVADVLYSLQQNMPLDIGTIIWLEIMDTGHSLSRTLPFPCLITEMCRSAGVQVRANLIKPMSPLGARSFSFQHTSGDRREARRHQHSPPPGQPEFDSQSEGEFQDSDYDPDQPEAEDQESDSDHEQREPEFQQPPQQQQGFQQGFYQPSFQQPDSQPVYQQYGFQPLPPYQAPPENPFTNEPPQYISEMFRSLQLGLTSAHQRMDVVHSNMQYMNQRMDWDGVPRTAEEAMGGQRRRRRRRHDGASGSGSGHGGASSSHQED